MRKQFSVTEDCFLFKLVQMRASAGLSEVKVIDRLFSPTNFLRHVLMAHFSAAIDCLRLRRINVPVIDLVAEIDTPLRYVLPLRQVCVFIFRRDFGVLVDIFKSCFVHI